MTIRGNGPIFLNFGLFYLGWFVCVLSAAQGYPWAGTATIAAIVAWHTWTAARPLQEINLLLLVVAIGAVWDSWLVWLGWVAYPHGTLIAGAAPYWILALWALFATALNVSMRWLRARLLLAALLGAVSGPLSYWAAARMGAVVFNEPTHALAALTLGWALIMPALMLLSRHYDGIAMAKEQAS